MIELTGGHIYKLNGRRIPGVTTVIKTMGLMDDKWWSGGAGASRGTLVHDAVRRHINGETPEELADRFDAYILGFLDGFKAFQRDTGFEPVLVEQLVYHPIHQYAGTLDLTGSWRGVKDALIDIKSGAIQPWTALQTSAYAGCLPVPHRRFCVGLTEGGVYSLIEYTDPYDWQYWLAALSLYNWRCKNVHPTD